MFWQVCLNQVVILLWGSVSFSLFKKLSSKSACQMKELVKQLWSSLVELAVSCRLCCKQIWFSGENLWQRKVSSIKILIQYTPLNMSTHTHKHSSSKIQCGLSFLYWMFDSLHVRLLSGEKSSNGSGSYRKSFKSKSLSLWRILTFWMSTMTHSHTCHM